MTTELLEAKILMTAGQKKRWKDILMGTLTIYLFGYLGFYGKKVTLGLPDNDKMAPM